MATGIDDNFIRTANDRLDRAVFKGMNRYGDGVRLVFEQQGLAYELDIQPETVLRRDDMEYVAALDVALRERR
jgi:hypothetical protein